MGIAAGQKSSSAVADIAKNRLHITIKGRLSKKILDNLYTDIRFCVADLRPGFDVIVDLTECPLAALSGIPTFKKITNHLVANRVGKVIRIIDKDNVVFKQILNLTSRMQGYHVDYVATLEEAEAELATSKPYEGLRFCLYQHAVEYIIDNAQGKGYIIDISTSGCAVNSATLQPSVGDRVSFKTTFSKQAELLDLFEVKATVVWVKENTFAVKFKDVKDDQKEQLWKRLVHESQCEIA